MCFYYINSVAEVQPFKGYSLHRSKKINKHTNKNKTEFVVKIVPRHELTQSIVKTNIKKSSLDNKYSCSSHHKEMQREHELHT